MPSKLVEYDDGDYKLTIEVHLATVAQGAYRLKLIQQARNRMGPEDREDLDLSDLSLRMLLIFNIPAIIAATTKVENDPDAPMVLEQPLTAERILDLPEPLVNRWTEAVLELNPHWAIGGRPSPGGGEEPSAEKPSTPD